MRTALVLISALYVLRGLLIIPVLLAPGTPLPLDVWSSLVVLLYGIAYTVGTWRAWPHLAGRPAASPLPG